MEAQPEHAKTIARRKSGLALPRGRSSALLRIATETAYLRMHGLKTQPERRLFAHDEVR